MHWLYWRSLKQASALDKRNLFASHQARAPWKDLMLQGIDALVVPQIQEADYDAFRTLIKLLPSSCEAWRTYQDIAIRKRGADAVVQVVTIAKHLQPSPNCSAGASDLATLEV